MGEHGFVLQIALVLGVPLGYREYRHRARDEDNSSLEMWWAGSSWDLPIHAQSARPVPKFKTKQRVLDFKHRHNVLPLHPLCLSPLQTSPSVITMSEVTTSRCLLLRILTHSTSELIHDFLSKCKGNQEKDLEQDFANIDIEDDVANPETRSLKYMTQLVRVIVWFDASTTRLMVNLATDSKPRATDACDRSGGHSYCELSPRLSFLQSYKVFVARKLGIWPRISYPREHSKIRQPLQWGRRQAYATANKGY